MDQHIFEQLDKLEASARADTRRHGDNYNGRTGHLAHDDSGASVDYSIHGGRYRVPDEDGRLEDRSMALEPYGWIPSR